jgi:hypothetical protein
MLALADDAALARLVIAATAIPRRARSSWLRRLAHTIEHREAERIRRAKGRARARNGRASFRVEAEHDLLVTALLNSKRLSEAEALDRRLVERELGEVLQEWARHWIA